MSYLHRLLPLSRAPLLACRVSVSFAERRLEEWVAASITLKLLDPCCRLIAVSANLLPELHAADDVASLLSSVIHGSP
jgi:hypothetical protein